MNVPEWPAIAAAIVVSLIVIAAIIYTARKVPSLTLLLIGAGVAYLIYPFGRIIALTSLYIPISLFINVFLLIAVVILGFAVWQVVPRPQPMATNLSTVLDQHRADPPPPPDDWPTDDPRREQ